MQDREKSVMINYPSLENPSSYYYNPKYEYTETRPARTLFTHQDIIDANTRINTQNPFRPTILYIIKSL